MSDRPSARVFDLGRFGEGLVRGAPDAIAYADEAGVIRFWNPGAERILGFAAAEAVGRSLDIIIPESLRARHWEGYGRVMRTGVSRYGAGRPGRAQGRQPHLARIHSRSVSRRGGRMRGIAGILRDVTKRFEEIKELRRRLAGKPSS
jgi:PAS domain S-box-containing protein